MKVAISNFSKPIDKSLDFKSYWANFDKPKTKKKFSLFEMKPDWGFHIYSLGAYLLDKHIADEVEFWDYRENRKVSPQPFGILRVNFYNDDDVKAYLDRFGCPDLYIAHGGVGGRSVLKYLEGKSFRVYVPASRQGRDRQGNFDADCYLVDSEEFMDKAMLYIPAVNTGKFCPKNCAKKRDFIYLASSYDGKRHDIIINAVRGTGLTGHFHPVDGSKLDLTGTHIATSKWDEEDVVELLQTSRIAVYAGDDTSNPASMWECVAAGLPIVVNEKIKGGKHLVVPGVTGEFASESNFCDVMKRVLKNADSYWSREYFLEHWDTVYTMEKYLAFFRKMGWRDRNFFGRAARFMKKAYATVNGYLHYELKYIMFYCFAALTFPARNFIMTLCSGLSKNKKCKLVFVFGMGRSGTTFLAEGLAIGKSKVVYIHEPVRELGFLKTRNMAFDERDAYINSHKELRLHYLVSVTFPYMLWAFLTPGNKTICVKDVRLNDSLEDVAQIFKGRILFISRHPCGRTESLKREERSAANFDLTALKDIGNAWGSTHLSVKKQFESHPDWTWVFFENLCDAPPVEFKKLYESLGLHWDEDVQNLIIKKTTVYSDKYYGGIRIARNQINKWKYSLRPEEIEAVRQGSLSHKTNLYEGF